MQNSKPAPELVRKIVEDLENDVTVPLHRTFMYAEELEKRGVIKNKAASWKDYFFEDA